MIESIDIRVDGRASCEKLIVSWALPDTTIEELRSMTMIGSVKLMVLRCSKREFGDRL